MPNWLDIEPMNYSMKIMFTKQDDYKILDMTDAIFIPDLRRKFIYEKKEQTLWDYYTFKLFVIGSMSSNWGTKLLYCSEANLKDDVCKNMKKYSK